MHQNKFSLTHLVLRFFVTTLQLSISVKNIPRFLYKAYYYHFYHPITVLFLLVLGQYLTQTCQSMGELHRVSVMAEGRLRNYRNSVVFTHSRSNMLSCTFTPLKLLHLVFLFHVQSSRSPWWQEEDGENKPWWRA